MDLNQYMGSLRSVAEPDKNLSAPLQALWYEARGDWEKAHQLIQDLPDKNSAWVHAYLHRREGDLGNASYWYHKAQRDQSVLPLDKEWQIIVQELLTASV